MHFIPTDGIKLVAVVVACTCADVAGVVLAREVTHELHLVVESLVAHVAEWMRMLALIVSRGQVPLEVCGCVEELLLTEDLEVLRAQRAHFELVYCS